MRVQNKKTIAIFEGKIDKKNKLNRSNKKVSSSLLNDIDNGVTIEQINEISKAHNLPIFRYQTQITIHGIFNELETNLSYGYKHIFQNKNKSIGIKYGAIDESKRQYLKKYLRTLNFGYSRNSTDYSFVIQKVSDDEETFKANIEELKAIADKIDKSLFYGRVQIYSGNIFGRVYSFLDLQINAIEQANVSKFLTDLGIDPKKVDADIKQEEEEREKYWKQKGKEREEKNKQIQNEIQAIKDTKLKGLVKELPQEEKVYLALGKTYDDKINYSLIKLLPMGRKKLRRYIQQSYKTFEDALSNANEFLEDTSTLYEKTARKPFKELYKIAL